MFLLPSIVLMAMGLEKKESVEAAAKEVEIHAKLSTWESLRGKRGDFHGMKKSIDICLYVCHFCYFFCVFLRVFCPNVI